MWYISEKKRTKTKYNNLDHSINFCSDQLSSCPKIYPYAVTPLCPQQLRHSAPSSYATLPPVAPLLHGPAVKAHRHIWTHWKPCWNIAPNLFENVGVTVTYLRLVVAQRGRKKTTLPVENKPPDRIENSFDECRFKQISREMCTSRRISISNEQFQSLDFFQYGIYHLCIDAFTNPLI